MAQIYKPTTQWKEFLYVYFRVSSFVGKVLHECLASEWGEDVFIPVEIVNKITMWITAQQHEDGHFEDTAGVEYDRSVQDVRR